MRALGVDFGERRVGLAISDADGRVAVPLAAITRRSDSQVIAEIAAVARRETVGRLVVGEPRNQDGTRGPAAARAARFAARLATACDLPYELVDETLTSRDAAARLRAAGVDPRRDPGRLDATAAQILLQEALDRGAPR